MSPSTGTAAAPSGTVAPPGSGLWPATTGYTIAVANTASITIFTPWTQTNYPTINGFPVQIVSAPAPGQAPGSAQVRALAPYSFNKYVNASDLLEEFIAYLGSEGVRKHEIMDLPVELFIKWLVIRACEVDQEEPGVVLTLPAPRAQPRCQGCGRWMARTTTLPLHDAGCAIRHFARAAA